MKTSFNQYLLLLAFLFSLLSFPVLSFAQETEEITQDETIEVDEDLIKEKVKERLDRATEGSEEDEEASDEEAVKWFAAFGTVSEATKESLLITGEDKSRTTIAFDEDTDMTLLREKKSTLTIEKDEIEDEWFAIAMGPYATDGITINAQRISFSETPPETIRREVHLGKIGEIDNNALTLLNGNSLEITIPKLIKLEIKGLQESELEDINPDDKAVVVVEATETSEEKDTDTKDEEENDTSNKKPEITYTLKAMYIVPSIKNPVADDTPLEETDTSEPEETSEEESQAEEE